MRGFIYVFLILSFSSCKDFLDIAYPKGELNRDEIFRSDTTALSAVAGMYSSMYATNAFHYKLRVMMGNSADELVLLKGTTYNEFRYNSLSNNNYNVMVTWSDLYSIIYQCNAIIAGLKENQNLSTGDQLSGEALFVRAFCYFYLVNLFGNVPLITQTDITETAAIPRISTTEIYNQIISDLTAAKKYLPADYTFNQEDRTRANKWAATAMLSRVYLYLENWEFAESEASEIIDQKDLFSLLPLNDVFLANSKEAIWQFNTIGAELNNGFSYEGYNFINGSDIPTYVLTESLSNSFDPNDLRKTNWTSSFSYNNKVYRYPYKYKLSSPPSGNFEYQMVLRLAEQYLIRAEARVHQNNIAGSLDDINLIRGRAGLQNLQVQSPNELFLAIEKERQTELFLEYGHRWFDLKRTGRIDVVLSAVKSNWTHDAALYPIPLQAINRNPSLLPNNPGY